MWSTLPSCQRAQENMSIEGSQPIVHLHRTPKRGFLSNSPSAVATVTDRDLTHPLGYDPVNSVLHGLFEFTLCVLCVALSAY